MTTNEFERDLDDQAGLKRPGRIDMRVFQNTADAGDGHPGVQRCFRNYLHEGGMEKDIDLIGFGIKGTSVNVNNVELQQLSNIGTSVITASIWSQLDNIEATTISAAQWVFVGEADQALKQADSPTFNGLTLNGNLSIVANAITGTSVNLTNAKLQEFSNIGAVTITVTQWGYLGVLDQSLRQADSPTFVGLTLSGALVTSSTVDGVDVLDLKTAFDAHAASTGASHTYIDQSVVIASSPTFVGLTLSGALVTNSTVDGVDVSDHSARHQSGGDDEVNTFEYDDEDPGSIDFDETDLTVNGGWNTLDLDSYKTVPAGVVGFVGKIRIEDLLEVIRADFKSTAQSNNFQICSATATTINVLYTTTIFVPLDSNHEFQYRITSGADLIEVTVLWWIY